MLRLLPSTLQPFYRTLFPARSSPAAILTRSFSISPSLFIDAMSSPIFTTSRLQGKAVVITGASSGIGRAAAILFARSGANVVLCARRKDALEEVKSQCEAAYTAQGEAIAGTKGGKFACISTDMRDPASIEAMFDNLPDWAKGKTDVLLNNAGLVRGREHVGALNLGEVDEVLDTNVRGFIHLSQLFVKQFKERNSGHFIALGSIAGREAYPGGSIYCASKFAVAAFTSALMKELVNTQIRVTEIQPGMVNTGFSTVRFRGDKGTADKEYEGLEPLTADDIAEDILFAASRPAHVQVAQSLIFPVNQASPYHNFRGNTK